MILRKAKADESKKIFQFYQDVIESIKFSDFKPKWNEKYPNLDYIKTSIEKEELYVYTDSNIVVSSFILNNTFDNDYSNIKWLTDAKESEIAIIHTFAIDSNYQSKGLSWKIFNEIKDIVLTNHQKTIRIDIVEGNVGAQNVFEKLGFKYITAVEITHYAVGLTKFHLYEFPLTKKE